jgi:hypothetical protein
MEETLTSYGKDSLMQLFALLPPLHLIMTIVSTWLFLPFDKNLKIAKEMLYHLYTALFWAGILFLYNAFVLNDRLLLSIESIIGVSISLLLSYVIACVFNIKFRVRIFGKKVRK